MRTPSRLMPLYLPEPVSWWKKILAYCVLALVLYVLLSATIRHPWILAVLIVLAISIIYEFRMHKQRLRKMADERENEGIYTFARLFERNQVDTWILRAVHEELQHYMKFPVGTCPLRASDKLEKELKIDPDDIEDLIPVVAQRTGRSLENTEKNPYFGKIRKPSVSGLTFGYYFKKTFGVRLDIRILFRIISTCPANLEYITPVLSITSSCVATPEIQFFSRIETDLDSIYSCRKWLNGSIVGFTDSAA
jgi:hypothetical protein